MNMRNQFAGEIGFRGCGMHIRLKRIMIVGLRQTAPKSHRGTRCAIFG